MSAEQIVEENVKITQPAEESVPGQDCDQLVSPTDTDHLAEDLERIFQDQIYPLGEYVTARANVPCRFPNVWSSV